MTQFEKNMLSELIKNGLSTSELTNFLANQETSMPSAGPQVPSQPAAGATVNAPNMQMSQGNMSMQNNTVKGGEENVDMKQLLSMIEKQNETIAAQINN